MLRNYFLPAWAYYFMEEKGTEELFDDVQNLMVTDCQLLSTRMRENDKVVLNDGEGEIRDLEIVEAKIR